MMHWSSRPRNGLNGGWLNDIVAHHLRQARRARPDDREAAPHVSTAFFMSPMSLRLAAAHLRRAAPLGAASLCLIASCVRGTVARQDSVANLSGVVPKETPAQPNQLTIAERAAGWRLLFDGGSLNGWRGLGYPAVPAGHWTVVDGAIKKIASGKVPVQADGQPVEGGDLMTDATYGDFELAWQWKVTPGANSGLKYNVSEELSTSIPPKHAAKGFEYQMI